MCRDQPQPEGHFLCAAEQPRIAGEGPLAVLQDVEVVDYDQAGVNLGIDQLYGVAKGMKVTRTLRAPAEIRTEHGRADGRSITWTFDLTGRAALAATKQRLSEAYDGVWVAAFDAEGLEWADVMEISGEPGAWRPPRPSARSRP